MTIMAYSRCTKRSTFASEDVEHHLKKDVIYGPDAGWVLLTEDALLDFCNNRWRNLEHRGRTSYDHICAAYGEWGFDARDSTYVCCVVFLSYRLSAKANKRLGEADASSRAKIFTLGGAKLLQTYQELSSTLKSERKEEHGRAVHVWERAKEGEIAIDFCLK